MANIGRRGQIPYELVRHRGRAQVSSTNRKRALGSWRPRREGIIKKVGGWAERIGTRRWVDGGSTHEGPGSMRCSSYSWRPGYKPACPQAGRPAKETTGPGTTKPSGPPTSFGQDWRGGFSRGAPQEVGKAQPVTTRRIRGPRRAVRARTGIDLAPVRVGWAAITGHRTNRRGKKLATTEPEPLHRNRAG